MALKPKTIPPNTSGQPLMLQYPRNAVRLKDAKEHLEQLFAHAESEQIGGRRYWGHIAVVVTFENGEAKVVKGLYGVTDKGLAV